MSKGHGRVERVLLEAFGVSGRSYTVEDLFHLAYPDAPTLERKHRGAIKRAASNVSAKTGWKTWRRSNRGGGYIYYDPCDLISYATARIKAHEGRYQCEDKWVRKFNPTTDEDVLASLAEGGRNHELIVEGGSWWRFVQIAIAKRDGDEATRQRLQAEADAKFEAWANSFRAAFGGKP